MKRYHIFLLAGLFIAVAALAFTKKQQPETKNIKAKAFALVELYTSEGCSSCPPADKLLAKIQQEYTGKEVYLLAYHVDYWNRLGWKDVFSSAENSQRQQAYARYLKDPDGVYTPQAIVNGKVAFVGSDEGKMYNAIRQSLAQSGTTSLMLNTAKITGNKVALQYHINSTQNNNTLLFAVVEKHAISHVKSGENGGRTLSHINIVHRLQAINIKGETGNAEISLPDGFNKDWCITGFIQNSHTGEILAAQSVVLDNKEIAALK